MRADLLSLGFPSYPRGVKKSQTINPPTLAPACRTGWMHQRDGAAYVRKPACWRSAWGIVPQGSQSLLSSSGACLAPHRSSKALGSSAHNSHAAPTKTFRILQARIRDLQPPSSLQPGTKEAWSRGEIWGTIQGNEFRQNLSIPAANSWPGWS